MEWKMRFKKPKAVSQTEEKSNLQPEAPQGILKKCNECKSAIFAEEVKNGYYICPKCGTYFRLPAMKRIELITDEGSFEEWDTDLPESNPLHFKGYPEKVAGLKDKTGLDEAVVTGKASIHGIQAAIGVMDGRFMMASMGQVVGEKITRLAERATGEGLPVILYTCSGGARMQEGMQSLMQMAKTSAAFKRHSDAGLLYIVVLTDPTTGGVTASFAMLGDIILAEPGALVGFAGPRVIEQTIGQKLPKGFQRAEFLQEHGFVDAIVTREEQKSLLYQILALHGYGVKDSDALLPQNAEAHSQTEGEEKKEGNCEEVGKVPSEEKENGDSRQEHAKAWDRVLKSRLMERPVSSDYIKALFHNFIEFHGDRYFRDDPAIVGGIALFKGVPVTVIAQEKGKNTKDNMKRNFGMPSPDGYRKALRLMKQAEKFHRPIICLVDTPGAYCGMEAEERGQGEAIARNLYEMSALTVPVLSLFIGEGGSGGALAMAVANEVWMMENSIYSILSPEGFASILWKDSKRAKEAAEVMRLTAQDLKELKIIDEIIQEPASLTEESLPEVIEELSRKLTVFLTKYSRKDGIELAALRYERFRNM